MGLLSASEARQVGDLLAGMAKEVHVRLYTQRLNCGGCLDTERILAELAGLSPRISLEKLNALTDTAQRESDSIEGVPAIIVSDGTHNRVRLYGTPSGYEFSTLLSVITDAGSDKPVIEPATSDFLAALDRDLVIRVFVTPTCPHCPRAAVTAARLAAACPGVRADIVEAGEFPDLSRLYGVQGVPRTVVNEKLYLEGAVSESAFVRALSGALPSLDSLEGPRDLLSFLDAAGE